MTAVQVLEVRRVDAGNLKAFAKVKVGCIVIHGCRVIQQSGQKPWVALPQVAARKKADGSGAGWFPVIEITRREVLDQIRDAVLAAWGTHEDRPPPPTRGQRTWDAARDPAIDSQENRDREVERLADQFDRRGPDEVPF